LEQPSATPPRSEGPLAPRRPKPSRAGREHRGRRPPRSDIAIGTPGGCLVGQRASRAVPTSDTVAVEDSDRAVPSAVTSTLTPDDHANGCPQLAYATGGQWPAPRPHRTSR
jgi:hypothetical protein